MTRDIKVSRLHLQWPLYLFLLPSVLLVAVFAGPLWDMSVRAGSELLDPESYSELVLDGVPQGTAAGGRP